MLRHRGSSMMKPEHYIFSIDLNELHKVSHLLINISAHATPQIAS